MFRLVVIVSLVSFLVVGGLLATDHSGIAIIIVNYLFFVLMAGVVYELDKK